VARVILGVNACFAVGRYPEPEDWLEIVGRKLDLRYCQFFSDLIEPRVEETTKERMCRRTVEAAQKYNVKIHSVFTGTAPHWCHTLLHPDEGMRKDALRWWESYFRMTPMLGANAVGGLLGSFSRRDMENPERKKLLTDEVIEKWHYLSELAKNIGLDYIMFEPMSVKREMPSTIAETEELYERINRGASLPVKLCMDVGHGARCSGKEEDRNPYTWIERFAGRTPVIHIQQTDGVTSKHWPFTPEYNKLGIIHAEKVLEAISHSGAKEVLLVLEMFHAFFEPMEDKIIDDLLISVEYWRKYIKE